MNMDGKQIEEVVGHGQNHNLAHLEGRINALDAVLQQTARESSLPELSALIYRPGWTTPFEFALVLASVEHMIVLTNQLAGMQRALVRIGGLIGTPGQAKRRQEGPPPAPPPREGGPKSVDGDGSDRPDPPEPE
jgi:hypothetical protein